MRLSRLLNRSAWSTLFLLPSLSLPAAYAQTTSSRNLLLGVYINGHDTQKVGDFLVDNGRIFATAMELRSLGIVPPSSAAPDALIDVAEIVSQPATIDERAQTISLTVPIRALVTQRLGEPIAAGPSVDSSPSGLLVNYDSTVTAYGGSVNGYGLTAARLFGSFGIVQSDFSISRFRANFRAVRLNTTYSYSDSDRLRTYVVGDVLSGALPYSRSLRIGGGQITTNFGLRPDLITYPVPAISGGAAVPSTVDVFVNGIRQLSTWVDAGPFALSQIPVVSGAGQVSVAVRDAAGHQTVQTSSFYLSSALLQPGLSSFSVEAGAIRNNFGLKSGNYGPLAVVVTGRHGVTSSLTVEGHAEGSSRSALVTGGATLAIGKLAIATAALGLSRSPSGTGSQSYFAIERTARFYHLGFSRLTSSSRFGDLGTLVGDSPPRRVIQANAGVVFGRQGSLGFAYTDITQSPSKTFPDQGGLILRPTLRTSIASATYSREIFGRAYLHLTGYSDLNRRNHAVSAGISFRFGGHGSVSASYESALRQVAIDMSRPAVEPGDIGWRAYKAQGSTERLLGELYYRGGQSELALGVDTYGGSTAVQASARGSIVAMAGSVFATTTITDGFAIVDTQGFGNVAVTLNNRPVGRTSKGGKLLVPGLASYHPNTISLDPGDLPLDTRWDRLDARIITGDRAGAVARFGMRRQHEVLVTIQLADGRPMPLGSRVSLDGSDVVTVSGYDGQAYFSDLQGKHDLKATSPDGAQCSAAFIVPDTGSWPTETTTVCN